MSKLSSFRSKRSMDSLISFDAPQCQFRAISQRAKGVHPTVELNQVLHHARGSLYEVQTQIKLAYRLGYLKEEPARDLDSKAARVGRVLNGLIRSFRDFLHVQR